MLYHPKGTIVAKHVVDAWRIMDEFHNAYRVASQTTQWQWTNAAFTAATSITPPVIITTTAIDVPVVFPAAQ